jgi:hypothetical protein
MRHGVHRRALRQALASPSPWALSRHSILGAGERADTKPGGWHYWWNERHVDLLVPVQVTPGERLAHLIETLFGLASEGHVNMRGMPHPIKQALVATEFAGVIVFRKPPAAAQHVLFGALAPTAAPRLPRNRPLPLETDVTPDPRAAQPDTR